MKKMMKNILTKIVIIALFAVSFTGCDDYLDVNTPASSVDLNQLNMKDIMAPVMHSTVMAQYGAATVFGNYTQYFGSYGNGAAGKAQLSSTWNEVYLYALPNLNTIKEKADEKGAKHYGAIADILKAVNVGIAADAWDNVPYSQASKPEEYPFPEFDTQEEVYSNILNLLNSAITALESNDPSGIGLGNEDLIYGGNTDKWLKAAYTFKARFLLRLMKKGKATAADVLAAIDKGLSSNSDDFELYYPENKINPWYSVNVLSRNTGNFYRAPNDQLITMMNGKTYPFESGAIEIDPRLPAIFENEGAAGDPWRGFMNGGDGESSDIEDDSDPDNIIYYPANTYYKDGGFLTKADAKLYVVTYAEAMFIKAEALFLMNGGNETSVGSTQEAYDAYMEGIAANMAKIGVNGAAYMADPVVAVGPDGLMLNHIMKEKYIANIHNPETFSDFRRYNFSPDVFKGLALRLETDDSDSEMKGKWYVRAIYPTTEKNTNESVVNKNWQEPDVPVWWAN
jgi:hypothetical protein